MSSDIQDYSASPGPSSRRSARSPSPSYYPSRRGRESYDRRRRRSPSSRHNLTPTKRRESRDYYSRRRSRSRSRSRRSRSQTHEQKPSSARQYLAQYQAQCLKMKSLLLPQIESTPYSRDSDFLFLGKK